MTSHQPLIEDQKPERGGGRDERRISRCKMLFRIAQREIASDQQQATYRSHPRQLQGCVADFAALNRAEGEHENSGNAEPQRTH